MSRNQRIKTPSVVASTPSKKNFKESIYEQRFIILSFFVPFLIMGIAFASYKVYPFGDQQILVTDFWQQYYPFYCNFQSKLQEGSSMLWSWGTGLGTNYIALISYYLASPMNLLLFFVPGEYLREALTLFLMAKVGCAGMFTALLLRNIFKKNDFSLIFFSLLFALSAFTMGYYWNIIWFDAIALCPLVVSGAYSLIVNGKYKTYVIALALTMIVNYYIGFFICIFMVILFAVVMVVKKPTVKAFFLKLVSFGGFSLLALCIGMLFMLPALLALQNTHSMENIMPQFSEIYDWHYKENVMQYISDILANTVTYTKPTDKEGLPNIYCGFISILLAAFYFRCTKISLREKIAVAVVLVFFLYCCVYKLPNFILHGFHLPNMLPYRFSFLISLVLVLMAYRGYTFIEKITFSDIFIIAVTAGVFIVFAYVGPQTVTESSEEKNLSAVIATLAVTLVCTGLFLLYDAKILPQSVITVGLFAVIMAEMVSGAFLGVKTVRVTSHDGYPDQNEPIQNLKSHIESSDKSPFYRMEMQQNYTINDSAIYGYNGVSFFSSTVNESVTNFVEGMGMIGWDAGNRYYYCENTPLISSILNINYMLARRSVAGNTNNWEFLETDTGANSYKNNTPLALGFMTNSALKTFNYHIDKNGTKVKTPFDAQDNFFVKATGLNEEIFTPLKASPLSTGFPVSITSATQYYCNATSDSGTLTLTYTVEKDNVPLYAYTHCENCQDNAINIAGRDGIEKRYEIRFPFLISLGVYSKGEQVRIKIPYARGTSGYCDVVVCEFNEDVYNKGYQTLNDELYDIKEFKTSFISGDIQAKKDGLMFTSIPYEKGWTAYVDGVKTEVIPLANNALVGVELTKGKHTVTFRYVPDGFVLSVVLFFCGSLLFALIILLEKYYVRQKKNRTLCLPIDQYSSVKTDTDDDKTTKS